IETTPRSEPLPNVPNASDPLGVALFLSLFIAVWILVLVLLLRLRLGEDRIWMDDKDLLWRMSAGPFSWTRRLPRTTIRRIMVSPKGHQLVAETDTTHTLLSGLGTVSGRGQVCEAIRALHAV